MTTKPEFNYAEWPASPQEGYRIGTNYLTVGLFVELERGNTGDPLYSLGETDVWDEARQRWFPSARLIYLASKGEHDAMQKLVGSFKQWAKLKELEWFRKELDGWMAEWAMKKEQHARELLEFHAFKNPSAAKTLFDDAKKKAPGRPVKSRAKKDNSTDVEDHINRVTQLRK